MLRITLALLLVAGCGEPPREPAATPDAAAPSDAAPGFVSTAEGSPRLAAAPAERGAARRARPRTSEAPAPNDAGAIAAPRIEEVTARDAATSPAAPRAEQTATTGTAAPSAAPPAEESRAGEPAEELPFDSISVLATLPPDARPGRLRAAPSSGALRRARSLRVPLRRARRAARGSSDGHTYRWVAFRLRSDDYETQVRAAVATYLRPHPLDFVYYCEVEATESASPDALDVDAVDSASERAAVERLAEELDALGREGELRLFTVRAGWADAVGGAYDGVVLVDPGTGLALWVFAEATWSV